MAQAQQQLPRKTILLRNLVELGEFEKKNAAEPQRRSYITELHIDGRQTDDKQPPWTDSIPSFLGGKLFNLESIHFERWTDRNTHGILGFTNAFPTVKALRFSHCEFTDFQYFETVLLSFPALAHLYVHNLYKIDRLTTVIYLASPNPRLQDVQLQFLWIAGMDNIGLMFTWLRHTKTMRSLRRLRLDAVHSEDDARAAMAFLQVLGPELQQLTIGCMFDYDTPMRTHFDHFIDMSGNTGLISLRLLVTSLEQENLPWVLRILAQLRLASRRIAEVTLEVSLINKNQLWNTEWDWIVARLGELNLRKVEIVHRGTLHNSEAEPAFMERFRGLPCGLLTITVNNAIDHSDQPTR
ncbi:hypothetical protein B0H21DRAFT_753699 [Amylocystis lapponica]|nr:hypothetical protein B0H21DRAFT_753699 [Amylocystis lapponica]